MPRNLLVFTGAGLSADSGIATFRGSGQDSLWMNFDVSKVADIMTWKQNFNLVHDFYNARRRDVVAVEPNPGHHLLKSWQDRFSARIVTQNIDDLLERAGCIDVLHVHGHLDRMLCTACGTEFTIGFRDWDVAQDHCPKCRSKRGVKPGVVFFGEHAPGYRPMSKMFDALRAGDVLVVIGTSGRVLDIGTVASLSHATTVLSNLEASAEASMPGAYCVEDRQFDHVVHGRIAEIAPDLDRLVTGLMTA